MKTFNTPTQNITYQQTGLPTDKLSHTDKLLHTDTLLNTNKHDHNV
jgi:hypothetical protein